MGRMVTTTQRLRTWCQSLAVVTLFTLALCKVALSEVAYGVEAGVGESDNITLASSQRQPQTISLVSTDFDITKTTRLIDVAAKGNFSDLDYLQGAYGNQLLGRFDGIGQIALIPDRLNWVMRDDFGQSALDPFTPQTPKNIENVNYFSTGPDAYLLVTPTEFLSVSGRYGRAQYGTSPFDSNRVLGELAFGRNISANSMVSLHGEGERVMFENTSINANFNRYSGYARYDIQNPRTEASGELGASTIGQTGASLTGLLAKLQLNRKITGRSNLAFAAGRILTDASTSFSNLQIGSVVRAGVASTGGLSGGPTDFMKTAPAALTSEPYTSEYASAEWQYVQNRTNISFRVSWEKDTYSQQAALDAKFPSISLKLTRTLTPTLTGEILGQLVRSDYFNANVAGQNDSSNHASGQIGGSLTWHRPRGLEVILRYAHDTWNVSGAGSGFDENRVFLLVGYRPHPGTDAPIN
jgi:hypothetical protein